MKKHILLYIALLLSINTGLLQSNDLLDNLPKIAGTASGTEFYLTIPPAILDNSTNNFVKIYVISEFNTTVFLEIASKNYRDTKKITVGEASEFSIPANIAQALVKNPSDPFFDSKVFVNSAIRLYSEDLFTAYALVKTAQSSEGFLVFPTSTLGSDYIISSYPDASKYYPQYTGLPSIVGIVAVHNGTEVNFTVGGTSSTTSSDGKKVGETSKKFLNKGDVWLVSSKGQGSDLSGSKVSSNLPISVISSNQCANIPLNNKYCNYIIEQQISTNFWGKTFFVGDIYTRKLQPIIRIYAKESNTIISLNGVEFASLTTGGGIINEAYLELRLDNKIKNNVISADKPISVTVYNSGIEEEGLPEQPGDPFMLNLVPIEQFSNRMPFSLPASTGGNNFKNNYINIICELDSLGNIPEDMILTEYLNKNIIDTKVKELKNILVNSSTVITVNNKKYALLTLKLPQYGEFKLSSSTIFTASMYGFSETDAYGYTANLGLADLELDDKEPPSAKYKIDCEGLITGVTTDLPNDVTKCSNLGGVIYYSGQSNNITKGNFEQIIAGKTKSINWNLKVNDISKDARAVLQFWDYAYNTTNVDINYKAPKISINTFYENYGSLKIGDTLSKIFTITNNGDSTFVLSNIKLLNSTIFKISNSIPSNLTLLPGAKFSFSVKFSPLNQGNYVDSLGFGNDCYFKYFTKLEAFVGSPLIEVGEINFGDVTIGKTAIAKATITNIGKAVLIINGYSNPASNLFQTKFDRIIDSKNTLKLEPNEIYEFEVSFTPINEDKISDRIVFFNDAVQKDSICIINAHGVKPGLIATSFNWDKKRIFRKNFPAGPYSTPPDGIKVINTSDVTITISGIEIISDINGSVFEFNKQIFLNQRLLPGKEFVFQVLFRPELTGYHELIFRYKDNMNGVAQSELRGYGVVPKIKETVIDYDTSLVNNISNPLIKNILIENLSAADWEFADSLNIYDLNDQEDEISSTWTGFGTKGFKFDKNMLEFPIKLAPGAKIEFKSAFVANSEGILQTNLGIISDAISTPTILLKGYGLNADIDVIGGEAISCINNYDIINVKIKNKSTIVQNVQKVFLRENLNEFSFAEQNHTLGFSLKPDEEFTVPILFKPSSIVHETNELVFLNSSKYGFEKSATISGKTMVYEIKTNSSPLVQELFAGDKINYKIHISSAQSLNDVFVDEMVATLSYNPLIALPDLSNTLFTDIFNGKYDLKIDSTNKSKGLIQFDIKNISSEKNITLGDMIELPIHFFKPSDSSSQTNLIFDIKPINNDCVQFIPSMTEIILKPVCANDLRNVNFSPDGYNFNKISPNPISESNFSINFEIGLNSLTQIDIYNSIGELVQTPISKYMKSGKYELIIEAQNLSSGLYYCKLNSGEFTESQLLLIRK